MYDSVKTKTSRKLAVDAELQRGSSEPGQKLKEQGSLLSRSRISVKSSDPILWLQGFLTWRKTMTGPWVSKTVGQNMVAQKTVQCAVSSGTGPQE